MTLKRLLAVVTAFIAGATIFASAASAQTCGMTGSGAVGSTATYDPFNPSGLGSTTISLTVTRFNPPGGSRTEHVRFILRAQSAAANGITITPIGVAATDQANLEAPLVNIFYNFGAPGPSLSGTPSAGNRFAHIEFSGNNAGSNTVTLTFAVTFPANLNLTETQNLSFDMDFACTTQPAGGAATGTIPNALTFPVRVLSGLQASFVGPALDFGEVGDKTDTDVTSAPATFTRTGNIRVASSGPYNLTLTSANGYRMTYTGGNLALENQILRYQLTFGTQTRNPTNVTPIGPYRCVRAGLGSPPLSGGVLLPVTVRLLEGGNDEVPAAQYRDELTVTLAPQVTPPSGSTCPQ